MNSHDILRTAVKIGGLALLIYTLIQASSSVPLILDQVKHTGMGIPVIPYVSTILVPLLFGFVLWLFPAAVANTIIKKDLKAASKDKFLLGAEKIAIRILGLYLLYHGISDLVVTYVSYYQAMDMFGRNIYFTGKERFVIGFIVTGTKILLAVLLILGAAGISNLLRKTRYA